MPLGLELLPQSGAATGGWRRLEQMARHSGSAFGPAAASLSKRSTSGCFWLLPAKWGYQDSANSETGRKGQNFARASRGDHFSVAGDLLLLQVCGKALPVPGQTWSCHGKAEHLKTGQEDCSHGGILDRICSLSAAGFSLICRGHGKAGNSSSAAATSHCCPDPFQMPPHTPFLPYG